MRSKIFDVSYRGFKLNSELKANGFIKNCFGRPIIPNTSDPRILYNYFVQSSAVDVSLIGFYDIQKALIEQGMKSRIVFIVHDACFIDEHPGEREYISSLTKAKVRDFGLEFLLRLEEVT